MFLPGESHGRKSLVGYSPQGRKESVTTGRLHFLYHLNHLGNVYCIIQQNAYTLKALFAIFYFALLINLWFILYGSCSVSHSAVSDSLWSRGPTRILCSWNTPGKNTGVGSYSLLQVIFLTQGSNLGFLYCRQILYCLSHQESPLFTCYWLILISDKSFFLTIYYNTSLSWAK